LLSREALPSSRFVIAHVSSYGSIKKKVAFAELRFHPDTTVVALYDFLADGKTYARSRVLLARMKPFEEVKNLLGILNPRIRE
jgi:hypothetical protein